MKPLVLQICIELAWPVGEEARRVLASWDGMVRPLLEALRRPGAPRVNLRLGGTLLEFLEGARRESIETITALAATGQVELLGGALYDAVLSAIPERDALSQLAASRKRIERVAGAGCLGACLARGAWDPVLPRLLHRVGYRYVLLDGVALCLQGVPAEGWYGTEREGARLAIFPSAPELLDFAPGSDPAGLVALLAGMAEEGRECVTWYLDLRSLMESPSGFLQEQRLQPSNSTPVRLAGTQRGAWLAALLSALGRESHWLRSATFSESVERIPSRGMMYVPSCVSGLLHGLPALLPNRMPDFAHPSRATPEASRSVSVLPWESVLTCYGVANRLHKTMLMVSADVERLRSHVRRLSTDPACHGPNAPGRARLDRLLESLACAERHLYRGQCAAPCQPDLWSGIHDGRLRHTAWQSLLCARAEARLALDEPEVAGMEEDDHDGDGVKEILVSTPSWYAWLFPARGGALGMLCPAKTPLNLLNTLSRREEPWHVPMIDALGLPTLHGGCPALPDPRPQFELSIEDDDSCEVPRPEDLSPAAPVRPPSTARDRVRGGVHAPTLVQDRDERLCFVEHFLGPQASLRNFQIGRYPEQSDFHAAAYDPMRAEPDAEGNFIVRLARDGIVAEGRHGRLVRVLKTYRFHRSETRLDVSYEVQNRYREPIHLRFGVELNLNLDSARTSAQWLEIDGQSRHALDQAGERARVGRVLWRDEARELQWSVTAEPSAHLWFHPIEIPRPSADGLTGSFQGTCLFFSRPLDLWGEERMTWDFRFVLERLRAS